MNSNYQKIFIKAEALYARGDALKIAEANNYDPETVRRALRNRKASPDLLEAIAQFYAEREAVFAKLAK
jgi:hypothetical protein